MSVKTLAFGIVSLTLALALAACGDSSDTSSEPTVAATYDTPVVTIQLPTVEGTPVVVPSTTPGATPDGTGTNDGGSQNDGDLPGPEESRTPLNRASQALLQEFHGKLADVQVLSIAPIAWPDGCLGLPKQGEACTQAVVPGFRIVLVLGEKRYIYRTNESGTNVRLEKVQDFSNVGDDSSSNN